MGFPTTSCPRCGKIGTHGMATHRRWCGEGYETRFWAKVKKGPGCWLWQGALNTRRYGTLMILHRQDVAHRVSWALVKGPIPDGMHVLHRCDNPPCVNPEHLFLGTHDDNMRDMKAKGRNAFGERTLRNKLTEADVLEIRASFVPGEHPWLVAVEMGKKYGVTAPTILNAFKGVTWSHL